MSSFLVDLSIFLLYSLTLIFLLHFPDKIPRLNGVHNLVRHLNVVHKYYMRVYFLLLSNMSEEFRATKQKFGCYMDDTVDHFSFIYCYFLKFFLLTDTQVLFKVRCLLSCGIVPLLCVLWEVNGLRIHFSSYMFNKYHNHNCSFYASLQVISTCLHF